MFKKNKDFYPTEKSVIATMVNGYDITDKVVFDPEGGAGDIVEYAYENGAKEVISCEIDENLRIILQTKCKIIAHDFLTVKSEDISHVDFIIMNPPFSADEKHILHAWEIAPDGCKILALCNLETIKNRFSSYRENLSAVIRDYGNYIDLGDCFNKSERKTDVHIALVRLEKPLSQNSTKNEYDGFFMEEEPEEQQFDAIMPYNFVRDVVNRYVAACKLFDEQLELGAKMNTLTNGFFESKLSFNCSEDGKPKLKLDFKKDMQKAGWMFIFDRMNLQKYSTKGLREDINKFVETQTHIPFTMKNIYKMLEIVIATTEQRMDKAILEVFDRLTEHYHENRYNVEGWKTNSHYLMNEKFILPRMCGISKFNRGNKIEANYGSYFELIDDMVKAICFITGESWNKFGTLDYYIRYEYKVKHSGLVEYFHNEEGYSGALHTIDLLKNKNIPYEYEVSAHEYGQLFDWAFFEIRAFKKGTMHFRFKDQNIWARFNQRVAKIKGYPLFEGVKKQQKEKC